MAVAGQTFSEQGIEQAEQQRCITARAYEQMLVGNRRRFTTARIDHHHLATPGLYRLQAFLHIRHGHDAAVRSQWIAAQDQHEIGVVDVRDRQQQTVAVHQMTGQVMGQLIDRRRGKPVAGFQQAEEVIAVGHQPVIVHARVALIDRHGVLPVMRLNGGEAFGDQIECRFPLDGLPFIAHPLHRLMQAIRIVLDVLQGHGLGADVPTAERVLGVALDRSDLDVTAFDLGGFDGQATDGFAQMARTVMESLGHGQSLSCYGRAT
ncbi:hypothetical protein D3C85_808210 [compost metagenome]